MSYNIILKELPLDKGLSIDDYIEMYKHLSGISALPIEVQSENSAAIGLINLTDAEFMGYDFTKLNEFIYDILSDIDKESENGQYEIDNGYGISSIKIYRGDKILENDFEEEIER